MAALLVVHVYAAIGEWQIGLATLAEGLVLERDVRFRVSAGGQYLSLVEAGEVWRLWTSVFVHADLLHLGVNAVAIYGLGRILEPWIGSVRLIAWFLVGGLGGSMVSFLARLTASDGASGGAFALLGAAVVLGWEVRGRLPEQDRRLMGPWLWGFLVLNLLLSLVVPSIDVVGHLGGLMMGLVLGGGIGLWRNRAVTGVELLWIVSYAVTCVIGWSLP